MPAPVSMTAFATQRGSHGAASWVWDVRSVNGKGLDLRLRLPDGIDGLEAAVRAEITRRIGRGNVSVGLKLARPAVAEGLRLNPVALAAALSALAEIEAAAQSAGITLAVPTSADVLGQRGVTEIAPPDDADTAPLLAAMMEDLGQALDGFEAMRRAEGAALAAILTAQLDQIEALVTEARTLAEARRSRAADAMQQAMARVLGAVEADPARIAQELALLAVKADVAEELDRLTAHIAAARALLATGGPVGRKFDFLSQEFNREANTLCSKAGDIALTQAGLELKHLVDQMREQVQNLE